MNKNDRINRMFESLKRLGISEADATKLRRIEMTLRRWGERECGDEHGRAIERDEKTDKPYETWDTGNPHGKRGRRLIPDAEKGALKRLSEIMKAYPALVAYHQADPRGCALYIVKRSDLGSDDKLDSLYTRGVSVCD